MLAPEELPDDARVVCVGGIGAPTVGIEKLRDRQSYDALRAIEECAGEQATAMISNEIGGSNSLEPLIPAAVAGLPVVDADGMGRAFPEFQMKTYFVYGVPCCPMALADEKGNIAVIREVVSPLWAERLARAVTVQMGCAACYAVAPMSAEQVRRTAIPHTLSLARRLARAVAEARSRGEDPVDAVLATCPGKVLFAGKVMDVARRTTAGFARGTLSIDGLDDFRGERMSIDFQNENLIRAPQRAHRLHGAGSHLRGGDRNRRAGYHRGDALRPAGHILGFPAPELWTTPAGLAVVGPRAFGYEHDYSPLDPASRSASCSSE